MTDSPRGVLPFLVGWLLAGWLLAGPAAAQEAAPPRSGSEGGAAATPISQLVRRVRPSVVVIDVEGRDTGASGVGTGFVVDAGGLIATNLHVIGEGRPLRVQTAEGQFLPVTAVHAWDRELDLAVLRVDLEGRSLPALTLGDSSRLDDGTPVVVMGNPLGYKHSVVNGVLSGTRELEGRTMLQLAVPIEPGNSGGPVMDLEGRVLGVVTMKSAVTQNLGFAVQVNDLKPLLEKPNPTPMDRWLKIGSVDAEKWQPLFGAQWYERGGRVLVRGKGDGFGGRSLCLARQEVPDFPCEVAVWVRLDDEAGAAGLAFHSDGGQRHYGFYPSNGRLRLSRFDGPDVLNWSVLEEVESPYYRPKDWNHLKVRVESERVRCYVNDRLVIESRDRVYDSGRMGLAKFRDTQAEFKGFEMGRGIGPSQPTEEQLQSMRSALEKLPDLAELSPEALEPLRQQADASRQLLKRQAERLERRAEQLRRIAAGLHVRDVVERLRELVQADRENFNLLEATLLVARLDDPDVDVQGYVDQVAGMAAEIRKALPVEASVEQRLEALNAFLFEQNGFHGSRFEYYHPANSHMHRVIDDRVGLPITLCVLYMELARRLDVPLVGVGLPGHFVVRRDDQRAEPFPLIDVFRQARPLSRQEAERTVRETAGVDLRDEHLAPASHLEILIRVLSNLRGLAQRKVDREALLRYLDAQLALVPEDTAARGMRSLVRFETGRHAAALDDLDWFLEQRPDGLDLGRIREMRDYFEKKSREQRGEP